MVAEQEKMLMEEEEMMRMMSVADNASLESMEEDMRALAEAELNEPSSVSRPVWDNKISKRRLSLNRSVENENLVS